MDTDSTTLPRINSAAFDAVRAALSADGPLAAVDRLCDELRAAGDYHSLFYALLMRKRVELGVSPFPTGPASDLPSAVHEAYEDAIRLAARQVGRIYLDQGDIPRAWGFFRLIGEPGPVREALANLTPGPEDDTYPLVDIAWHQQVYPEKGFDIILERHGICSAITMVGSADLSNHPELRTYCVRRLVRSIHDQLSDRLRADLAARGIAVPDGTTITQMIEGRDELFADDAYHVDVSHLSSVVQMSLQLPPGPELGMARELCEYGRRLAPQFRGGADMPFEHAYADYLVYLQILDGFDVENGLAHFRQKVERGVEEGNIFPAEVYINLLVRLERLSEALAAARHYLVGVPDENLTCPGVAELARRLGDFAALSAAAEAKGDAVNFLAGLIAARMKREPPMTKE
jgi:hypothetical protein